MSVVAFGSDGAEGINRPAPRLAVHGEREDARPGEEVGFVEQACAGAVRIVRTMGAAMVRRAPREDERRTVVL